MTKEYLFGIQDYHKATWGQNFVASVAGAVASITVAAPLDTVKTRIQNANFENKVSGMTVVKELIKNEELENKKCIDCGNPNPQWASLRSAPSWPMQV